MERRSVTSGLRRQVASPRSCCAPVALALALSLALAPAAIFAQAPELRPATPTDSPNGRIESAVPPTPLPPPSADASSADDDAAKKTAAAVLPPKKPNPNPTPAPKESENLATALERPGDLNLHGLTLNAALFAIGEQWNINIVSGELQGTVNGVFTQAPLREILDAILLSNGYNYRAVGKSLVVSSVAELGQVNPFFQSATIPVQSADIDEVAQGAQLLITPKGQVRALKSAHSIVVLDFPDRVKMIREFVATLDGAGNGRFPSAENRNGIPLEVGYFRTQHISAKTAEQALQAVMSKEGRVGVLEKEDRLLVTDYAQNLAMVEKVLQRIDHPRPQVRITALIYDISLQDIERLGINWNPTIKGRIDGAGDPQSTLGVDSITQVPFAAGAAGNTLTFMNLSQNLDITAVARCLQGAKDARLLADPNVLVLENEDAHFEKVSEIPYQQLTQTAQGGSIGTTAFKKAGITLHVRPKIATDGIIRMEVNPEVSRLTGFTPGDNQPIIDTSSALTTLSVANRQTVVIGGLRQRSDVGEFNGVPYLKDLKLVGRLFRSRDTDVRESELVVFISPEIVSYSDEPNCRQKIATETIDCRLDQIPEAEGCPPCCRRLPPGSFAEPIPADAVPVGESPSSDAAATVGQEVHEPVGDFYAPEADPVNNNSDGSLPPPKTDESPEPMSASQIPSAEFQFGIAGRNDQVQTLVADGRLRRLPTVPLANTWRIGPLVTSRLFEAPAVIPTTLTPAGDEQLRTAERTTTTTVRR